MIRWIRKNAPSACLWVALACAAAIPMPGFASDQATLPQDGDQLRGELLRRTAEVGLLPDQTRSILERVDRIEAAELPSRPVLDRYLEGLAKGIPLARIEAVVDQLEERLRDTAREIDRVFPREQFAHASKERLALIDDGAYALALGLPASGLEQAMRLAAAEQGGPKEGTAPVLAVGCLVGGGIEPEASLEVVRTAWNHGYRGEELERLGRDLGSLGRSGHAPASEVVAQIMGMIRSNADRENVFRNLDALCRPATRPGEDPNHMHGPGGPPDNPGGTDSGGHRHHGPHGPGEGGHH
jgi:hypothetical protein